MRSMIDARISPASSVRHSERDQRIDRDRRDLAERQFNARLSAYRDALGARVRIRASGSVRRYSHFSGGSLP